MFKIFKWFWRLHWFWKVVIIGLIILITYAIYSTLTPTPPSYKLEQVQRANLTEIISESGIVELGARTDVFSPTRGIITELFVNNGDIVGVDQQLFKVESTATQDQKLAAYANYIQAKDALNTATSARQTLQNQLEVARKGILDAQQAVNDKNDRVSASQPNPSTGKQYTQLEVSSIDSTLTSARYNFDNIEKQYVESSTTIQSAQAAYSSARLAYISTLDRIVKSPAIGTIANLAVAVGDSVLASVAETSTTNVSGLDTQTTLPVLSIANFSANQVVLQLRESDINKIDVGQAVTIFPETDADREYQGIVKRMDQIGYGDAGVVKFNAYIEINQPDAFLKSGMTVDVDIITAEAKDVLTVPNAAVKPYQGGRAVRIVDPQTSQPQFQPVEIGIKGIERTEITSGLQEGQEVITSLTNEQIERNGLGF
jgi:HlyD family secretion protein